MKRQPINYKPVIQIMVQSYNNISTIIYVYIYLASVKAHQAHTPFVHKREFFLEGLLRSQRTVNEACYRLRFVSQKETWNRAPLFIKRAHLNMNWTMCYNFTDNTLHRSDFGLYDLNQNEGFHGPHRKRRAEESATCFNNAKVKLPKLLYNQTEYNRSNFWCNQRTQGISLNNNKYLVQTGAGAHFWCNPQKLS